MKRNDFIVPFRRYRAKSSPMQGVLPGVGLFGTGIIVGAGVALLLVPKSGARLRAEISEKSEKFKQRARQRTQELLNSEENDESQGPIEREDRALTNARTLDIDSSPRMQNDDISRRTPAMS